MSRNKSFTKLSLSLLPLEDIKNMLRYGFDFITKEDKATDVISVAGVPAERIARSISTEDRDTVLNAKNLDGKPSSHYMTKKDGESIQEDTQSIKSVQSKEIFDVRDELYQLRRELQNKGIVGHAQHYSGFSDSFINNDPVYEKDLLTTVTSSSARRDEIMLPSYAIKELDEGDYVVIHHKDVDRFHVGRITNFMPDNETVKFTPSSAFNISAETDIYKSLGMYYNGSYAFCRDAKNIPTTDEKHSTLNDDTVRQRRNILNKNSGFGYTFRVPDIMFAVDGEPRDSGYLVRAKIKATRYGTPGPLMAYVINENDIERFKSPEQAERDGFLVGKSKPATLKDEQVERLVEFDFHNGISYPILRNDPEIDKKTRFCLIVEATGDLDVRNYYRVMFLQHKNEETGEVGDLQLNNIVYEYEKNDDGSERKALVTDAEINRSDLYYGVVTKGIIDTGIIPHREGVYTSRIKLQEPTEVSRARLTMRINREGYFKTANETAASVHDGNPLRIKKDPKLGEHYDMHDLSGIGAKINEDPVVVGNQIRVITDQNADAVRVEKGVYVDGPEKDIYRVGYRVYLKAVRKEYSEAWNEWVEVDKKKIELPLIGMIPDRRKENEKVSDRLMFESEILENDETLKYYNDFELQVYWKTSYSSQFDNDRYKMDFMGRVHDLVLSFDKTL